MTKNQTLARKKIVLAVTGSIAAVETIRLAHALRRKGAELQGVMSPSACGIIHPDALTYATGKPVICSLSGMVEHVALCGEGGWADLLVIAPCTANTLCKVAAGIDDTTVTTFATTAIGNRMPVIVSPAMHHSMYRHPGVARCIQTVREWGIHVIDPRIEEGKAKIASIEDIVLACERELLEKPLAGRHILVTSGACREPLDDVRVLSTRSTGKMGQELGLQAYRLGADVTVVHNSRIPGVRNIRAETAQDMHDAVVRICESEKVDLYISAAAISDFSPERREGKIPSGSAQTLEIHPLPKLITEVSQRYAVPSVAFKLGDDAEEKAGSLLGGGIFLVVANGPESMGSEENSVTVIGEEIREEYAGTKERVAMQIWDVLLRKATGWMDPD